MNTNAVISVALNLVMPMIVACAVLFSPRSGSWLVPFLVACVLCPLAAAFFGHVAKRELRKKSIAGSSWSRMATAGLVIGYLELALLVLVGLTSGERPAPYESVAVGSLRSINFATHAYAEAHPKEGFPTSLSKMCFDAHQPPNTWSLDPALASGTKSHYRFTYIPGKQSGTGIVDGYQFFADPLDAKDKDLRHFFTDQSEVIRMSRGVAANDSSIALQ